MIFGQFRLPTWGAQGVQRIRVSGSSRLPEPPWGPNGPQAPSKLDFWSILIDFWSIWDRFWIDFGTILGRFWGRCWSIFVWLLMDNVSSLTNLTNLTNLTPGTVAGLARRASGYLISYAEKRLLEFSQSDSGCKKASPLAPKKLIGPLPKP